MKVDSGDSVLRGHELRDANCKGVWIFFVSFGCFAVVVQIGLFVLLKGLEARNPNRFPSETPPVHWEAVPAPRLEVSESADWEIFRAQQQKELTNSMTAMSIDRAMQQVVGGSR